MVSLRPRGGRPPQRHPCIRAWLRVACQIKRYTSSPATSQKQQTFGLVWANSHSRRRDGRGPVTAETAAQCLASVGEVFGCRNVVYSWSPALYSRWFDPTGNKCGCQLSREVREHAAVAAASLSLAGGCVGCPVRPVRDGWKPFRCSAGNGRGSH